VLLKMCVHEALNIMMLEELFAAKPGRVAPVPVAVVEGSGKVFVAELESKMAEPQSASFEDNW
jgi:hypothetical protein